MLSMKFDLKTSFFFRHLGSLNFSREYYSKTVDVKTVLRTPYLIKYHHRLFTGMEMRLNLDRIICLAFWVR